MTTHKCNVTDVSKHAINSTDLEINVLYWREIVSSVFAILHVLVSRIANEWPCFDKDGSRERVVQAEM